MNTDICLKDAAAFMTKGPDAQLTSVIELLAMLNSRSGRFTHFTPKDITSALDAIHFDPLDQWGLTVEDLARHYPEAFFFGSDPEGNLTIGSNIVEKKYIQVKDLNPDEVETFNRFLSEELPSIFGDTILLTDAGNYRSTRGIAFPARVSKLTPYLKLFPDLYQINYEGENAVSFKVLSYKPITPKPTIGTNPAEPVKKEHTPNVKKQAAAVSPAVQAIDVKKPYFSPYRLFDNILFEDLNQALEELITMTDDEEIFVMPDAADPSPYDMLVNLIELRYCKAVRHTVSGHSNDLVFTPLEMWFNTGLRAASDHRQTVFVHAVYNHSNPRFGWAFKDLITQ